jgi:hypothetical protein
MTERKHAPRNTRNTRKEKVFQRFSFVRVFRLFRGSIRLTSPMNAEILYKDESYKIVGLASKWKKRFAPYANKFGNDLRGNCTAKHAKYSKWKSVSAVLLRSCISPVSRFNLRLTSPMSAEILYKGESYKIVGACFGVKKGSRLTPTNSGMTERKHGPRNTRNTRNGKVFQRFPSFVYFAWFAVQSV